LLVNLRTQQQQYAKHQHHSDDQNDPKPFDTECLSVGLQNAGPPLDRLKKPVASANGGKYCDNAERQQYLVKKMYWSLEL
jgi:hypothetical protein